MYKKPGNKEKNVTDSIRIPAHLKTKRLNMTVGEKELLKDLLIDMYTIVCDGGNVVLTDSILQLKCDIAILEQSYKQAVAQRQLLEKQLSEAQELEDTLREKYAKRLCDLDQLEAQERDKEKMLHDITLQVLTVYFDDSVNDKEIASNEILEKYMSTFTNRECIHDIRNFVSYHLDKDVKLLNGECVNITPKVKESVYTLCDSLSW